MVGENEILLPDRRGNNRLDTLRNIVTNPLVSIIFLIPNVGETMRVSGTAEILIDETLCQSFSMQDKPASSILSIKINRAYFQCQKAIVRFKLWDVTSYIKRSELPTAGEMIKFFDEEFDAKTYDKNYPEYMKKIIY